VSGRATILGLSALALLGGALAITLWLNAEGAQGPGPDERGATSAPSKPGTDAQLETGANALRGEREQLTGAQAAVPPVETDPNAVVVLGSVRTNAGAAVPAHALQMEFAGASGNVQHVTNLQDGAYATLPLQAGKYTLRAEGDLYQPLVRELVLLPGTGEYRLDLELAPWIRKTVRMRTPSGAPLAVTLMSEKGFDYSFRVDVAGSREPVPLFTDVPDRGAPASWMLGNFVRDLDQARLGSDIVGTLRVPEAGLYANAAVQHQVIASQRIPTEGSELVFELDPDLLLERFSAIQLRVVDARSRLVIAGAQVSAGFDEDVYSSETVTKDDGTCSLLGLPMGRTLVRVRAEGFGVWVRWYDLPQAKLALLGDVALAPAVHLRGRVVDPRGASVSQSLEFVELDPSGVECAARQVWSRVDKGFDVEDLAQRRYVVRCRQPRHSYTPAARQHGGDNRPMNDGESLFGSADGLALPPTVVDLTTPPSSDLVLQLVAAPEVGIELGFEHEGEVLVRITNEERMPVAESFAAGKSTLACKLAPGSYVVSVLAGKALSTTKLEVDATTSSLRVP
jgi:hypothetical protein